MRNIHVVVAEGGRVLIGKPAKTSPFQFLSFTDDSARKVRAVAHQKCRATLGIPVGINALKCIGLWNQEHAHYLVALTLRKQQASRVGAIADFVEQAWVEYRMLDWNSLRFGKGSEVELRVDMYFVRLLVPGSVRTNMELAA